MKATLCARIVCGTLNVLTPACDVRLYINSLFSRYKRGCSYLVRSSQDIPLNKEDYYSSDIGINTFVSTYRGCKHSALSYPASEIQYLSKLCDEKEEQLSSLSMNPMVLREEKQEIVLVPKQTILQQHFAFFKSSLSTPTKEQARPLIDAFANALENFLNYAECSTDTRQRALQLLCITEVMGDFFKLKQSIEAEQLEIDFEQSELKGLIKEHKLAFDWLITQMIEGLVEETVNYISKRYGDITRKSLASLIKQLKRTIDTDKVFPLRGNDPQVAYFY